MDAGAGVDIELPAGTRTAIVGETGSGKTTLGYLVARLYDAERGAVRIDGVDVRELTFDSLADTVGVVSQETYLFHASVRENLRFARPDATDEEIEAAARAAQVHEVVAALPDGYDTIVGERGFRFSGGEKQRIAIARTILRNPPVLVLDEATSALDVQTERAVEEALDRLAEGRTTIVIAHRLSTVREADQIVVLDAGRVAERGTHDELLAARRPLRRDGRARRRARAGVERPLSGRHSRRRPTYCSPMGRPSASTAIAAAALFVALGGPATAARLIDGSDIEKGTIGSKQVQDRSLKSRDLSRRAIRSLTATPGRLGQREQARPALGHDAGARPRQRAHRHRGRQQPDGGGPRLQLGRRRRRSPTMRSGRPRSATTASARPRSPTSRSTAARSSTAGCSRATSRASRARSRSTSRRSVSANARRRPRPVLPPTSPTPTSRTT